MRQMGEKQAERGTKVENEAERMKAVERKRQAERQ